ncbi:MAG TPA: long-chain fatty acid--CoA ligase, partial [Jatrophihabitans sp.]|nr:long-chain fatty acid--CoA ligase [Jatrophihabitans sp.]
HAVGLRRGDTLALMLTTRPEFHLVDCAAMHLGAVPFSIYNTSTPEQVDYFLRDSGARIAVVESSMRDRVNAEQVFAVEQLEELAARGSAADLDFDATWQAIEPDDPLTLIYTSGTTGDPKAVQISHRNMVFTSCSYDQIIGFPRGANVVSYLPMAHIAERNCSHYYPMMFAFRVTSCPDARQVASYFPEVRPTWFFAVPRIFEKLQAAILSGADDRLHGAIERALARDPGEPGPEADEELFAGLRERLGLDQIKGLNVGAAPMPPSGLRFFHAIGLPLGELWGMSETTGAGACNPPSRVKIRTVGPPMPGIDIRLADDGEVELRGDCVTPGYRNKPELTRDAFTDDGWLRTGDIGAFDEDGYLAIVDRKKELIINAAGKNMSPTHIESKLKEASPLIGSAVAIGDRRPYNVALIVLDPDGAGAFARRTGLGERALAELATEPSVVRAIDHAVVSANAQLARVEQIKRFRLLATEWQPGGAELTPTMKLKRKPIEQRYAAKIEELYAPAPG